MSVNPLTFVGNSSIIDVSKFQNPTAEQEAEIKQEFAKMFVDKVFMNKVSLGDIFQTEEDDEENLFRGMFSNDISKMLVDDIFRQQVAQQMVENGTIDLGLGE
ncbi:MAG: hypothetical protein PHF25_02875 [Candidatus Margulisbacteria bacterium]|nr:hypothetical protein [Candidatus Margulisiibacteriota bacterium]